MKDNLTEEDFEPSGVLGSRGISPEVARDAFAHYVSGDKDGTIRSFGNGRHLSDGQYESAVERSRRSPGLMMQRYAVPESDEPFILDEMRPDRAIWSGGSNKVRSHRHDHAFRDAPVSYEAHVRRNKVTAGLVSAGVTATELADFQKRDGWAVTEGGDHDGVDPREPSTTIAGKQRPGRVKFHQHVEVAKYLFPQNGKSEKIVVHDHEQRARWSSFDHRRGYDNHVQADRSRGGHGVKVWRRELREVIAQRDDGSTETVKLPWTVLRRTNTPGVATEMLYEDEALTVRANLKQFSVPLDHELHLHAFAVDETHFAQRLSWHPYRREERWERDRVLWCLEGCLKEASAVSAGEATFSSPSISLWEAAELEPFARNHLRDKRVYVVCDSDWERSAEDYQDPDSVIRQTLLARDRLRELDIDAHVAAPPPAPNCPEHGMHTQHRGKHGLDDHLSHGVDSKAPGTVDQLVVVERELPWDDLSWWFLEHEVWDAMGRTPKSTALERNVPVLKWLAMYASTKDAWNTAAFSTIADRLGFGETRVKRAIQQLSRWGCVETKGVEERAKNFATGSTEWVGYVKVHDDLRAKTDTISLGKFERELEEATRS